MNICIYGASSDRIDESYKNAARELGKSLGEASFGMVFGGGATGLMGAAARGLRSVGKDRILIGVAPRFFDEPGVIYEGCSEIIWTETMRERKQKMEDLSDGFVVLPGGIGTFEEFFEILTLRELNRHNKPIILYNFNGYYDRIRELLQHAAAEKFMTEEQTYLCSFADSAEEILQKLKEEILQS
ncbi:MAG: TIGR00730 family Rossman fold protein [Lachnospiraceae bacterium]|nr:TIGR00730 family Rossman fold protein [Lachnospiraceae bacterium]MDY4969536.1 TIGR00730 family Rossman fold protein [Lachnospiraceae bacterium]